MESAPVPGSVRPTNPTFRRVAFVGVAIALGGAALLGACRYPGGDLDGGLPRWRPRGDTLQPPPESGASFGLLAGTAVDDLWFVSTGLGKVAHADRGEWEVVAQVAVPHRGTMDFLVATAGRGALFVHVRDRFEAQQLVRVSSDGTVEDLTSDLPAGLYGKALVSRGASTYLLAETSDRTDSLHLFEWNGGRFVDLQRDLPMQDVHRVHLSEGGVLWVEGRCDGVACLVATQDGGESWRELPAPPCGSSVFVPWVVQLTGVSHAGELPSYETCAARWTGTDWEASPPVPLGQLAHPGVVPLLPDAVAIVWLDPESGRVFGRRILANGVGPEVTLASLTPGRIDSPGMDATTLDDGTIVYPYSFRTETGGFSSGLVVAVDPRL